MRIAHLRQAADHMVNHDVGRLPIISCGSGHQLVGLVTRSDLLSAYRRWLSEGELDEPVLRSCFRLAAADEN